jgi:N-acetylneuraminate synthase
MPAFEIGSGATARYVGDDAPTYFIADISANHDGSLERARELIRLAAENGASAAKFQNFRAPKIVSDRGFAALRQGLSHQARWKKSVVQVYQDASLPWEWTELLKAECTSAGIDYFSTPYDLDAVDMLDGYVELFKIGSGDITWREMVQKVAAKNKPVLLATGASDLSDVQRAVAWISEINPRICVMQCNTNYTGSIENFKHIHLNVLRTYRALFPDVVLGLSCHTPGHATVLGAVALGARVVEKHFTDDTHRDGPDHPFSMTPAAWREMVDRTRELEYALGNGEKSICSNEQETVVVQRRCLRAARDLPAGTVITRSDLEVLRPAMPGCILPYQLDRVIGSVACDAIAAGDGLRWSMLSQMEAVAI